MIAHHVVNDPYPVLCLLPTEADCRDYSETQTETKRKLEKKP